MPLLSGRGQPLLRAVTVAAFAVASIAYLGAARAGSQLRGNDRIQPAPAPTTEGREFSADLSIRQAYVGADGQPRRRPAPTVSLRLERSRLRSGWRTTLTLENVEEPMAHSVPGPRLFENPFLVTRMEYDDGTELRMYNRRGERVHGPNEDDRRLLGISAASSSVAGWPTESRPAAGVAVAAGERWFDNLVSVPERRAVRRSAIEARFGQPKTRVAGLDRYLSTAGEVTTELLVDPDAFVPVEINTIRRGELVGRTTFGHEVRADGVLVRRRLHAERVVPDQKDERSVLDIDVTNVTAGERGGQ